MSVQEFQLGLNSISSLGSMTKENDINPNMLTYALKNDRKEAKRINISRRVLEHVFVH